MYKRFITDAIIEALDDTPVVLVNGARQVGKSTLCKGLLESGAFEGQFVTMDDPATLSAAQKDPLGFLQDLHKHAIIDEVQRAPDLFLSMKKLVDEDRKGRRMILTGSADVLMLPKVGDSLAGRLEIHNLWPLSQDEMKGKHSGFLEKLVAHENGFVGKKVAWKDIAQMIRAGGYPEPLARRAFARKNKWFQSYMTSLLQKDVRELSNIEGLTVLPTILQLIATRIGSTMNMSDIARLSGTKNTTLQRYLALLEHIFLIVKIPAWTPNTEGQFVKSPKVYFNDTGLLTHFIEQKDESFLNERSQAGPFLENFVIMEILKQLSWSDLLLKPYHFSIHKGAEVDLVLKDGKGHLYGIEIKSSASLHAADFKGLKRLADLAGNKFKKGIILYTGENCLGGFGKDLYAVPLPGLWLA